MKMADKETRVTTSQQGRDVAEQPEATWNVPVLAPAADIKETKDGIVVELDMPGADRDTIDVTFERRTLTVSARGRSTAPSGHALTYAEYRDGDYERSFRVSELIDGENIDAAYHNGVLRLHLPYTRQAAPKRVKVRVG